MNEQIKHFLSTLNRSDNTLKTYRQALTLYADLTGGELDNDSYEKFLRSLKKYSPSTKSVFKTAVKNLFIFCEIPGETRREKLDRHYIGKIKPAALNFDRDAIEKLIAYVNDMPKRELDDWRDRAFVLMAVDSGFRISELCNVMCDDIDWNNQRVPVIGKGDKPAFVRLSNRSLDAIDSYYAVRGERGLKHTGKKEPLWIQHGNVGVYKPMTPDGMRKAIKKRMVEAGIPKNKIRIHDFRHYFVTMTMLASDIKTAKEFARHESIKTTDRYSHLSENELDQKYDEIFNRKLAN